MLYHLLYPLRDEHGLFNVFRYQTFRAMAAFLFTFVFVLVLQPAFIRWLQSRGVRGQPIRNDGPREHEGKRGTPTMGGLVVVAGVVIASLLFNDLLSLHVWLTIGVVAGFAVLGFTDDWRKITKQDSAGVSARTKLAWQCGISGVAACILYITDFSTALTVPFFKEYTLELGPFFIPFVMVVVVGASNAVNLTDGLDGLAIGPVMTVAGTYALLAYLVGHVKIADYLAIPYVAGSGELSIVLAAVLAAGLGFLWYNTFPAQVFMGDIGALTLGALLGFVAVLIKHEILLIVAGGIFVLEAVSVILQVYSFKLTGRRIFRMAPLHHHFELKGWAEPKIIVRFWIVSIVLALLSLTTLKLR